MSGGRRKRRAPGRPGASLGPRPILEVLMRERELVEMSLAVAASHEAIIVRTVDLARDSGFTWQQVADALGVSRQAAHRRYGS